MKGSKKAIKTITIAAAVLVFGVGVTFAVKTSGSANSTNVDVTNTHILLNLLCLAVLVSYQQLFPSVLQSQAL